MEITKLTENDLDEVVTLVNSAYRGDSSRQGWTTEADLLGGQRTDRDTLAAELGASENRVMLVLREKAGEPILGCVFLDRITKEQRIGCYLGMLTVNPALQNRGLGKVLLRGAEDFARKWGAGFMRLGVIQLRESLIAWYERHGYRRNGKTEPFPYEKPEAGIPQRDDLHFVMFEREY